MPRRGDPEHRRSGAVSNQETIFPPTCSSTKWAASVSTGAWVMLNLLGKPDDFGQQAQRLPCSEYFYTPGFFLNSQRFHRFNVFGNTSRNSPKYQPDLHALHICQQLERIRTDSEKAVRPGHPRLVRLYRFQPRRVRLPDQRPTLF